MSLIGVLAISFVFLVFLVIPLGLFSSIEGDARFRAGLPARNQLSDYLLSIYKWLWIGWGVLFLIAVLTFKS